MKWITASQLEEWADKNILSRIYLSEIVSSLIRASVPRADSFQFPTGDSAEMRGYDGSLESEGAPPFVPEGSSVWEFSTEGAVQAKAERVYTDRTENPRGRILRDTTFVFVTPRAWSGWDEWGAAKKSENKWKDVRVINAVGLEEWLGRNEAVAARIARTLLPVMPTTGALSTDEFWELYASRFEPPLTEQVLLAGRNEQTSNILQQLGGTAQSYRWQADSLDEVVAFAVAAIRLADDNQRKFIEARTLILETKEAAQQLAGRADLTFLLRAGALELAGLLGRRSPTIVPVGRERAAKDTELLRRPRYDELAEALKTMRLPEDRANKLARECGRSVSILSRRIGSPGSKPPVWRDNRALLPALLAGAWSVHHEEDLAAIQALTDGQSYPDYEKTLFKYKGLSEDHPLELEGDAWAMRAPVDAFVVLGFLIGTDDLRKFAEVATKVFSEPDPALELPPEERFYAGVTGKRMKHSDWLRRGIATTLLLMAEFNEEAQFRPPGTSAQDYVNNLIRKLPGIHSDYRAVASLYGVLPMIAEAAPRPLLEALGHLTEGDGQKMLPIFQDKEADLFHSSSPHTALLWALETLAWDPEHLADATLILARLARIDPGGKLANRPIASLREIFLIWHPGTNATLEQRLSAIDQITRAEPKVGWDLLIELLPKYHPDVSTPTAKPRYREASASQAEPVTYASVGKGYKQIVDRVLKLAGDDPTRWIAVSRRLSNLSPQDRERAVGPLGELAKKIEGDAKTSLWSALRAEVNRHRRFADAAWAMKDPDLKRLEDILALLQPQDTLTQIAWLFDDYNPDLPDVSPLDQWQQVQSRRTKAALELYQAKGTAGILELARTVKLPAQVGFAFANGADLDQTVTLATESLLKNPDPDLFTIALSAGADFKHKSGWRAAIKRALDTGKWSAQQVGALVLEFSDEAATWTFVESLGQEIDSFYWSHKGVRPIKADADTLDLIAAKYLSHNRALAALDSVWYSSGAASSTTLLKILDAAVSEINANPDIVSTNLTFAIEQIFQTLRQRGDVPAIEIARREYAYLPLLQYRQGNLTIHSFLVEDPEFFVSILCDIFKPSSGEPREPTEAQRAKASAGYRLLSELSLVPGFHGEAADPAELASWTARVRELAAARDRAAIADEYIGHVLAHAPNDPEDGAWPHQVVRNLIEDLANPRIEQGIRIERFNMRGPTMRGPFEGGNQERALAAMIREWSAKTTKWPKTTSLLREMAAQWERHAEDEDTRARQDEMRFS